MVTEILLLRNLSHIFYRALDRLLGVILGPSRSASGFRELNSEASRPVFVEQGADQHDELPPRSTILSIGFLLCLACAYFASLAFLTPEASIEEEKENHLVLTLLRDEKVDDQETSPIEDHCRNQEYAQALELSLQLTGDSLGSVRDVLHRWNESQQKPAWNEVGLLERMAIEGNIDARTLMLRACQGSTGLPNQTKLAAEAGHLDSILAQAVRESREGNLELAANWFYQGALMGSVEAMYRFGECCLYGNGISVTEPQAVRFLDMAASHQHAKAMTLLGICYRDGLGVEPEEVLAAEWFQSAVAAGDLEARFLLGSCYVEGIGFSKNPAAGAEVFLAGARSGSVPCMVAFAKCAENGIGVETDPEGARFWYEKAAAHGDREALAWFRQKKAGEMVNRNL